MKKPLNNINSRLRILFVLLFICLITSCSSIKLIRSNKNPKFNLFKPKKILVVGVTPDYEARKTFEFKVITQLNARKINALQSAVVFESSFKNKEQTEKEIELEIDKLLQNNYDTVLVSLVKGIDENELFEGESSKTDYHLRRFALYYLTHQNAYFNEENRTKYKVYNIETTIYNLKKDSDKSLVWQGTFDLVDPNSNTKAIETYVKKLIKTLEKEKIIPKKFSKN
ncbi:hypothetical protein [uncultured Algibacter sp.]|uniref:hypothetical protein n=1 Tax=uncultured Algibacter sp. TaxID=298659 RepID=UPI00260AC73E|nr:hypothetical protein [uncultured Algibacter sp.]